jgi:hypothetical protein
MVRPIGTNLTPVVTSQTRMISKALSELLHMIQMETIQASAQNTGTRKTMYAAKIGQRVFRKAGIPAGSTAADDPGANFRPITICTSSQHGFQTTTLVRRRHYRHRSRRRRFWTRPLEIAS